MCLKGLHRSSDFFFVRDSIYTHIQTRIQYDLIGVCAQVKIQCKTARNVIFSQLRAMWQVCLWTVALHVELWISVHVWISHVCWLRFSMGFENLHSCWLCHVSFPVYIYAHIFAWIHTHTHVLCFRVFCVVVTPCVHIYFYTIHIEVCICML